MILIAYDDIYLQHDTGLHPENASRLTGIMEHLKTSQIYSSLKFIKPRKGTTEEVSLVHPKSYISLIEEISKKGGGYLDADTVISPKSYEAALFAVGGNLDLIDMIVTGDCNIGYALVRPPGHHALSERGMGFCLFNNAAIAARYAQTKYKLNKILIVDWDVHHGNGTQDIFYDDENVFYFSLHQYPFYPGSGAKDETGSGKGKGFTLNIPIAYGTNIHHILSLFENAINEIKSKFSPDLIIISAGYDGFKEDPIGGLDFTPEDFRTLSTQIMQFAKKSCEGKILLTLEGGYNVNQLGTCVEETLKGLI